MDRFPRRRGVFDSQIAAEVTPRNKILGLSGGAAILITRRDRFMAAAIDADLAAVVEGVGPGLDVDDPSGAQAILRRQRAGKQVDLAGDAGVEDLPEGADAVRKHDAVDAVLNIAVLVTHVQLAAGCRILRDAGRLQ